MEGQIDVLLVDAFDADGVATSLTDAQFCRAAARRLTERGVVVMNLWGKTERYAAVLSQAAAAFGPHALLVSVSGELNLLLFASRRAPPTSITTDLADRSPTGCSRSCSSTFRATCGASARATRWSLVDAQVTTGAGAGPSPCPVPFC